MKSLEIIENMGVYKSKFYTTLLKICYKYMKFIPIISFANYLFHLNDIERLNPFNNYLYIISTVLIVLNTFWYWKDLAIVDNFEFSNNLARWF